jgi:LPS export ABC transporter permease LptG
MAVLVSTLVTVAVMTKNSELIVMRACGISLYRTAFPLVLFGVAVGGALFMLQDRVLPSTNRETDRLNRLIRGLPPQTSPFSQRWIASRAGDFYHYELFDERTRHFANLWVYDVAPNEWRLQAMTFAKEAKLAPNAPQASAGDESVNGDGLVNWEARDGWRREFNDAVTYEPFAVRTLAMEPPSYYMNNVFDTEQMSYDEMLSYAELRDYVDQRKASGADVVPYLVALQRKIAFPFVTLIMTMLAVPFAAATGRRGALYGIGAGIVLAISYFLTMSIFGALGAGGVLPPTVAAWAPNVIFGAAALYMVLTVRT